MMLWIRHLPVRSSCGDNAMLRKLHLQARARICDVQLGVDSLHVGVWRGLGVSGAGKRMCG